MSMCGHGSASKSINDLRRLESWNCSTPSRTGAPVQADRTLAYLRKALRWHATRDETFVVPIVPGMARTKPKERARTRVLDDDEIRDLYAALDALDNDAPKCFPAFVQHCS